jgi:hypothetical protein
VNKDYRRKASIYGKHADNYGINVTKQSEQVGKA